MSYDTVNGAGVIDVPRLSETYQRVFGGSEELVETRAPGRVNLIGEHTDYNDGFVLPVAVDREVRAVGARRDDDLVVVYSMNYDQQASFDLRHIRFVDEPGWLNYPQGMAYALQQAGHQLGGMNVVLWGDVPLAAGMSSSAAIEIACILLFEALNGLSLDARQDVLLAQKTENQFVGVQSGVMDQFISRLGQADHALMLDCRSLEFDAIPLSLPGYVLGVVHSGVPRGANGLASSAYNTRREECSEGVRLLQQALPGITALRDVTADEFTRLQDTLPELIRRRCRHVISENERVIQAAEALRLGDVETLGALFEASHASMRDDYEISMPDIDTLVRVARDSGAVAARMTGGGFGGCTVNIVPESEWEQFQHGVTTEYPRLTGRTPTVFRCRVADGAAIVSAQAQGR